MPFAAKRMNLEIIIVSEISQRKTIVIYIIYIQNLKKMIQMNLFIKQKDSYAQKINLWLGESQGEG